MSSAAPITLVARENYHVTTAFLASKRLVLSLAFDLFADNLSQLACNRTCKAASPPDVHRMQCWGVRHSKFVDIRAGHRGL